MGGNRYDRRELAGAFGDLGTLVPFVVGYITIARLDPQGVLLGFGPARPGDGVLLPHADVALVSTRLLFLSRAEVLRLCQRRPAVAVAMLKTLARRVRHFADIVSDLAFRPVTERVARYLDMTIGEPIEPGTSIELTLTQAHLAARLGTVRELVARAFAARGKRGDLPRPFACHHP